MPMYGFRCPRCGMEFEVSRKMSAASNPATCPLDGEVSDRIFTAPATILGGRKADVPETPKPAAQPSSQWSHFGHSHGYGAGGHSHGAPRPPAAQPPAKS